MKNWYQSLIALTLVGVIYLGSSAMAQVPSLVNYQGRLLDSGDNPISGLVAVEVDIYTNLTLGSSVYFEDIGNVFANNGLFKFQFGAEPGFAQALSHPEAWLALTVDDNTVGQRQRLVAVPYAQVAASVIGDVTVGNVTNATPAAGAIRWNGESFEGYTGDRWVLLSPAPLPPPPPGMVIIPEGSFIQGASEISSAQPVTTTVSAVYMDQYEVTQDLWNEVYDYATNDYTDLFNGPAVGPSHPVVDVSWYDCVKWCNARSEKAAFKPAYYTDPALTQVYRTGDNIPIYVDWSASAYRLPTNAEWEKAARGGDVGMRFHWDDNINHDNANYDGSSTVFYDTEADSYHPLYNDGTKPYTAVVGEFPSNGFGLYDMGGNVAEWCWDWEDPDYTGGGAPYYTGGTNPHGPPTGFDRITRGGGWDSTAPSVRIAARTAAPPTDISENFGFRAVLVPVKP